MFVVSTEDAECIRRVYIDEGELAARIVFQRQFPGITNPEAAMRCVRTIASWQPPAAPAADG